MESTLLLVKREVTNKSFFTAGRSNSKPTKASPFTNPSNEINKVNQSIVSNVPTETITTYHIPDL